MGKRSGDGFVAHKAMLVNALSRALSDRVTLMDFTIGRRGLLGYLKALGGSNIVKVVPSTDSAGVSQANGHKRLKVICGANTSYLSDSQWIGDKTPLTICEVRVSPNNTVKPNIGSLELAEAIARVLPFTAKDDNRPILQCVYLVAKDGKLTLVSADGFRLAVVNLDYDGEGQALIDRAELQGIASALKSARRARISFEGEDVTKVSSLIIDTELIRYKWLSNGGQYPDYEKLIPTEFNTYAHFDTVEAIKAVNTLKALSDGKDYPIDIWLDDSGILLADSDEPFSQTFLPADVEGKEGRIRLDGHYLAEVLRACGGMVELKVTNASSPTLFSQNGYQVVVMPMMTSEVKKEAKAEQSTEPEPVKPKAKKPKAKKQQAKQPVAV